MLAFALTHFGEFFQRAGQVSIFNDVKSQGLGTLWISFWRHLGMFQVQGDYNGRHNRLFGPSSTA